MSFPEDALTRDAFLGGRLTLLQPRRGYRAAADPVFLAAFVPAAAGQSVLELGCGAGAASLCLAARVPGLDLHGLELQADYADLARRNAALNGIGFTVHEGDLRAMPTALAARNFDHLLMNPPFHPAAASPSPLPGRAAAHTEDAPLGIWIDAALRRLRPQGCLTLIHLAARLDEVLAAIAGRTGRIEILPLAPREGRPASRVLVRAVKGAASPLVLHPPLVLHAGLRHLRDGDDYTVRAARVLRKAAPLPCPE